MDGHDGNRVRLLACRFELASRGLQPGQECPKTPAAAGFKLAGQAEDGEQVGAAGCPGAPGGVDGLQTGGLHGGPDQSAHGYGGGQVPQGLQRLKEGPGFVHGLGTFRRLKQGVIEAAGPVTQAHLGQIVGGKAKHGASQHGSQRDILPGIVDHSQQTE